jgi:hypothetical protein
VAISKEQLNGMRLHVVTRTERGLAVIRHDPRALPRRLRLLLLSIDGGQSVQTYQETLHGFGDIAALLVELINLGLVQLQSQQELLELRALNASDTQPDPLAALDMLLEDSQYDSQMVSEMLYGTTTPGSFDELLRVAQEAGPHRAELPTVLPPPPPPAPVSQQMQDAQLTSLFEMLEATRGERKQLKSKLAKLYKLKKTASRLLKENQRLQRLVSILSVFCFALVAMLLVVLLRR